MDEYVADYTYARSLSCISESETVCAVVDHKHVLVSAYGEIRVWNTETMSVPLALSYEPRSPITAVCAMVPAESTGILDLQIVLGLANGSVVVLDTSGEEVSGYRVHRKKVLGISRHGSVCVSHTNNELAIYDSNVEAVLLDTTLSLPIRAVCVTSDAVYTGHEQGILHSFPLSAALKGIAEKEARSVSSLDILGFVAGAQSIFAIFSDGLLNLDTDEKQKLNHKIRGAHSHGPRSVLKTGKNKYCLISIENKKALESAPVRAAGPVCHAVPVSSGVLLLYADNTLSMHEGAEDQGTVSAGRDNLVGIAASDNMIVGATQKEARVFAKIRPDGTTDYLDISTVIFEEPDTIYSLHADEKHIYFGTGSGIVRVKNSRGEDVGSMRVSESPVLSLHRTNRVLAVATQNRVLLQFEGNGGFEEIDCPDEVLCVKLTGGGCVLAALADSTVKVYKIDGEHILTLYGHALPVVAIEVCAETGLVYTLGADKLVKIWSLQFGDCRKTLRPGEPLGILLQENTLLVSTSNGLVYYHRKTLQPVKTVAYTTGKKWGVAGQNRILALNHTLYTVRERSVSVFSEGQFGVVPEYEAEKERERQSMEEEAKQKRIHRIDRIAQLEDALEQKDQEKMRTAFFSLTRTDIQHTIDAMTTETKERFIEMLAGALEGNYNPLLFGWAIQHLVRSHHPSDKLPSMLCTLRKGIRAATRKIYANRSVLQRKPTPSS